MPKSIGIPSRPVWSVKIFYLKRNHNFSTENWIAIYVFEWSSASPLSQWPFGRGSIHSIDSSLPVYHTIPFHNSMIPFGRFHFDVVCVASNTTIKHTIPGDIKRHNDPFGIQCVIITSRLSAHPSCTVMCVAPVCVYRSLVCCQKQSNGLFNR